MNRQLAIALTCLVLTAPCRGAQQRSGANTLSNSKIVQGVSRLLRWASYWETWLPENYIEGSKVEIAVVESPKEVAAFLGEIGISARFDLGGNVVGFTGFRPTTNSLAMEKYIKGQSGTNPRPEQTGISQNPAAKEQKAPQKDGAVLTGEVPFTLPRLEPPEAILQRLKSRELTRLKVAVPEALADRYSAEGCGKGQVVIPYFSEDDPWVDVYVDLGGCGKGIIYFTHREKKGPWKFSRFWPNKPPDDFSSVIEKIQANAAATIQLPISSK